MNVDEVIANAQAEAEQRAPIQSGHPTEAQLWAYLHNELESPLQRQVGAHVGSCSSCRTNLTTWRGALAELDVLLTDHLKAPSVHSASPSSAGKGWSQWLTQTLQPIFAPRRWAWHAAAFVGGSTALLGLNSYLHEAFVPEPSPFGSPPSPPWWAEWWTPYAVGAWAGLLGLHGLVAWRRHQRNNGAALSGDSSDDEHGG